jgi:hypothetical protein
MMTNKRILKQQYLETKSRAGVYAIRNRVTSRAFISGSTNVQGVLNRHRFELRQGTHRNQQLSQDWSLHGESSFSFEVLDMLNPGDDATFNVACELEELVSLRRLEIQCEGVRGYDYFGKKI